MNYDQAMRDAEKLGTERRNKRRPTYRRVTWSIGGILALCAIIWMDEGPLQTYAQKSKEEKLAGPLKPKLPTVGMPANGYSNHVVPPVGYATHFEGHGYVIHCVYADGSEGIVGHPTHPCGDGHMLYQYLQDTTGQPNSATYEFVRPGTRI